LVAIHGTLDQTLAQTAGLNQGLLLEHLAGVVVHLVRARIAAWRSATQTDNNAHATLLYMLNGEAYLR
jgi:hypothetical protein